MNLEPYLIDFDSLNVGDEVFHARVGMVRIARLNPGARFAITTERAMSFHSDGKADPGHQYPAIFKSNPFEAPEPVSEFPKLMQVWSNPNDKKIRYVLAIHNRRAVAVDQAATIEEAINRNGTMSWVNFEDLPEPVVIPKTVLNRADIARLAGCPIEELEILED